MSIYSYDQYVDLQTKMEEIIDYIQQRCLFGNEKTLKQDVLENTDKLYTILSNIDEIVYELDSTIKELEDEQ